MHERLNTHAESIAFFGGGAREKAVSVVTSEAIIVGFWSLSTCDAQLREVKANSDSQFLCDDGLFMLNA